MAETIFDVRDFGAKGDGVTNDRDAIQAAADAAAANGGGVVYIPAGIWGIGNGGLDKTDAGIQLRDNVTLRGDGPGETVLMVLPGNNNSITGVVRTPFDEVTTNVTVEGITIDGNRDANSTGKVDGFFCGTAPNSTQQCADITVRNVEIKDCSGYGFDPHEQTVRLTIENCVAHGNGLDGFTLDFLIDSVIRNNVAYNNDRHGFNVVTSTRNTLLENNDSYGNGGNGITVQRGSEDIPSPHDLIIRGGEISGNALAGILLKFSHDIEVDGVYAHGNMREGLKIYGSSEVTVRNSRFEGNSQAGAGAYNEIYTNSAPDEVTGRTWVSSGNTIVDNTIVGGATIKAAYGIRESKETFDSFIDGNTISGMLRAPTLTGPQVRTETPDLRAPVSAFHYTIPAGSYVDIDAGDTVRLALQLIDASGNLVNGGVLPSWLTFDPTTGTISGTPTSATTVHLRVAAADRSDDTEFDPFVLTVSPSGPYNVKSGTGEPPPPSGVGTAGDDSLLGTSGSDSLSGLGGRDTIDGAAGADTMAGGDGDDLFRVDNVGDVVSEVTNAGAGGVDTVESSVSIAALWNDVENLTLLGSGHLNATGNNGGNRIIGNAGNNVIDGGLGDDTMIGGAGNDTYVVNVTTDVVQELAGGGIDTVQSAVTYTLGANLENLTLTGTVVTGTGNELDNRIVGNASGNRLAGKEGNDTLDGLGGADSLSGAAGRDMLFGGDGDDTLDGGADADVLWGGLGADSLVGDTGFDYVRYDDAAYAGFTVSLADPARNTGVAAGDRFSGIEGLILGTGNDYGFGDAGDNYIYGMGGHDQLFGGAGADYLHGGAGFDYARYDDQAYAGF
ncbi:right-handed parallel beta-helix repeat-containing protein, partial [Phenylobacterium terrae]